MLAPGRVLDLPGGVGRGLTVTLQALVASPGSAPLPTNAVVLEVQ